MKKLFLSLFIPCAAFACQDCVYEIQQKIDETSLQIIRIENSYVMAEDLLVYLHGRLDSYYDAYYILQNHCHVGCCP